MAEHSTSEDAESPASPPPQPIRLSPLEGYMPRAYVRQIYCFPTTDPRAISTLSRGLSGLARDVPYILARVIANEGSRTVALSAPCLRPEDVFSCHDGLLSDESVSYAALRHRHFPPDAFLAPGVIPADTLPPLPPSPAVFFARASRVAGGLVLCVALHHAVTDITGLGALLGLWASHCRGGGGSPRADVGFDASWLDRGPLFSNPEPTAASPPIPDLLHIMTPEEAARSTQRPQAGRAGRAAMTAAQPDTYQTAIFYFARRRLQALKDAVNAHIAAEGDYPGSWVSTGDVLSAVLWSAILGAVEGRTSDHHHHPDTESAREDRDARVSTLSFPVQFRDVLRPPLPRNFLGAAFVMASAGVPHGDVCLISCQMGGAGSGPMSRGPKSEVATRVGGGEGETGVSAYAIDIPALASVALAIRRSAKAVDDTAVREVLRYLEAYPGVDAEAPLVLGPPRSVAGGGGVSVVSWADQRVYELDWGAAVGRCDTVRLSKMAYERDPIVLPRVPGPDGGLEVIMSYDGNAMRRLIESPVMRQFSVVRCLS